MLGFNFYDLNMKICFLVNCVNPKWLFSLRVPIHLPASIQRVMELWIKWWHQAANSLTIAENVTSRWFSSMPHQCFQCMCCYNSNELIDRGCLKLKHGKKWLNLSTNSFTPIQQGIMCPCQHPCNQRTWKCWSQNGEWEAIRSRY